ncbi:YwaF family protein [Paenisporosarcina antarctica]|uniref:TIGR02206 family membrane protein n=1 Tax=Paenisporosarcina antarctica TaxID=417367 RepID=A0A4P6ZW80_9BACL|nr:TIGR02206 family membrane protein [Paenisporosarcina antarctica]QBP39726.1 TIGR02206 family membrane protein [Paenisporosarcina antarctica]
MIEKDGPSFVMFSTAHLGAVVVLCIIIFLLFIVRKKWSSIQPKNKRLNERLFALTLLIIDTIYYVWLFQTERWNLSNSLPLELCSISLAMTIVLLWTGNKHVYDFVFYAGIGGALQAIATPVLDLSFPHFRYFHFFYTHIGIISTALYFTWVKGYRPTFKGIIKTMVALNVLLPIVFAINVVLQGNYMFLRTKPTQGSLLDLLGPYPWYIVSLEIVTFIIFVCLWLLFKKKVPFETR